MRIPVIQLLALLVFTQLISCASITKRMTETTQEGDYDKAVHMGKQWQKRNESKEGKESWVAVQRLVGVALYKAAAQKDTVQSYQEFRQVAERATTLRIAWADLIRLAVGHESNAYYRDITLPQNTIAGYREYRKKYPDSDQTTDSKTREVAIAIRATIASQRIGALQAFQQQYAAWTEAKNAIARARTLEAKLAFEDTKATRTMDGYQEFYHHYGDWPEAIEYMSEIRSIEANQAFILVEGEDTIPAWQKYREKYGKWTESEALVQKAYDREASLAIKMARSTGSIHVLEQFQAEYDLPLWKEKADEEIARLILIEVHAFLNGEREPTPAFWNSLKQNWAQRPFVIEYARGLEERFWKTIKGSKHILQLQVFQALFPHSRYTERAAKLEREVRWENTKDSNNPYILQAFFKAFPDDPRSLLAEQRYLNLKRLQQRSTRWPQTRTTFSQKLPNGDYRISVDVRDCFGNQVSGLTQEVFDVYYDAQPGKIIKFLGLEEERPIDVVFAIDLSGSMSEEREAVRQAAMGFADMMTFRGREARFGLITFGSEVESAHNPTSNLRTFRRWMDNLGDASAAEDTPLALLEAGKLKYRKDAERVVILVTDEPLQIHANGLKAVLGIDVTQCPAVIRTSQCHAACGRKIKCYAECARFFSEEMQSQFQNCKEDFNASYCLPRMGWKSNAKQARVCQSTMSQNFPLKATAEKLNTLQLRTFMLVPDSIQKRALNGFEPLSKAIQGEVLLVPLNSRNPEPYREALLRVAERLSKQYILETRPAKGQETPSLPLPTVRHAHLWRNIAKLPQGQILGLFSAGGTASCPELLLVTKSRGVFQTTTCGARWERFKLARHATQFRQATATQRGVSLLTENGGLMLIHTDRPMLSSESLSFGDYDIQNTHVDATNGIWAIGRQPSEGWSLLYKQEDKEFKVISSSLGPRDADSQPTILFTKSKGASLEACVLVSPSLKLCYSSQGGPPVEHEAKGLPKQVLVGTSQGLSWPNDHDVLLLSTKTGVFRSIDAGEHWSKTLPKTDSARTLTVIPGKHTAICASSSNLVHCSEDRGRSFFEVGRRFDSTGSGALATVDRWVFMAQGEQLHRLERIANRDMATSNVYFSTNSDEPQEKMQLFLDELVVRMRKDSDLFLRVEGHADQRGTASANMDLSRRRAAAVVVYMQKQGIPINRLQHVFYGESRPIRKGSRSADLARNRRVELILLREMPTGGWGADPCTEHSSSPE